MQPQSPGTHFTSHRGGPFSDVVGFCSRIRREIGNTKAREEPIVSTKSAVAGEPWAAGTEPRIPLGVSQTPCWWMGSLLAGSTCSGSWQLGGILGKGTASHSPWTPSLLSALGVSSYQGVSTGGRRWTPTVARGHSEIGADPVSLRRYFALDSLRWWANLSISVSACLSVCLFICCLSARISQKQRPNFTKFSVHITMTVTRFSSDNMLCTSGFVDYVMFSRRGGNWPKSSTALFCRIC